MLIKLQKTRFSPEYSVIENAKNVTYRDKPYLYKSEEAIRAAMQAFINDQGFSFPPAKRICLYQLEDDGCGHQGYSLEFADGYGINELSFYTDEKQHEIIRFDGEAYICNDEGKTVHRIKRGGCPSVFNPEPQDDRSSLAPKAA